jgi:hypothetical protein
MKREVDFEILVNWSEILKLREDVVNGKIDAFLTKILRDFGKLLGCE